MILDTNALSALADKNPSLIKILDRADRLALTLISYAEYRYGCRRSKYRDELEHWLDMFMDRCELLEPSIETVSHYLDIRFELHEAGTPIPANDVWIAALVRKYQMPILSLDRHFDYVQGIERIGW